MSLTANILSALATNAAIIVHTQAKYTKNPTVQLGINLDELPPESACPLLVVTPASGLEGRAVDVHEAVYVVTAIIAKDTAPTISGNIKKYAQVEDLETLRTLTLTAIEAADLSGGYVASAEYENDPIELFPLFSVNMVVKIAYPAPMRGRWSK